MCESFDLLAANQLSDPVQCVHREGCKPDVDSVDKRNNVEKKNKRDNYDPDFTDRSCVDCSWSSSCARHHNVFHATVIARSSIEEQQPALRRQGWHIVARGADAIKRRHVRCVIPTSVR